MKRVLLVGGSGQLGTAIEQRWEDCEIIAPPHAELALEDTARLRALAGDHRPDVLVNAAAFHDVDRCEAQPDRAFEVNAAAAGRAAGVAAAVRAVFVTLSSDYVFDGRKGAPYTEADAPNPLSVYGRSRLAGEQAVEASGARAFIVRTCGLYGGSRSVSGRRPLIDRLLSAGTAGPVQVVADVVASPTFAGHLAAALRSLLETTAYGLYHAAGAGATSWYEFAVEAARAAGNPVCIEPIPARDWKAPAIRPPYSALDNARLRGLGIELPSWRDGVTAYLANRVGSKTS